MPEKKKKEDSLPKEKNVEDIVAEYLGVHPKYFIYEGWTIRIDVWQFEHDGNRFNGWAPDGK